MEVGCLKEFIGLQETVLVDSIGAIGSKAATGFSLANGATDTNTGGCNWFEEAYIDESGPSPFIVAVEVGRGREFIGS